MTESSSEKELTPLEHLSMLKTTWSDEIPDKIVHSDSRIMSKARRSWFQGVVADTANALEEGLIRTPKGRKAAERLLLRFTSEKFIHQHLMTEQDIQMANRLIVTILGK